MGPSRRLSGRLYTPDTCPTNYFNLDTVLRKSISNKRGSVVILPLRPSNHPSLLFVCVVYWKSCGLNEFFRDSHPKKFLTPYSLNKETALSVHTPAPIRICIVATNDRNQMHRAQSNRDLTGCVEDGLGWCHAGHSSSKPIIIIVYFW